MGEARGSSERTRGEILRAARELFATRGIAAVTVRDIAAEAGVTHALVHRYFGTKEEMLAEILRREVQAASSIPVVPDFTTGDPLEMIRRGLMFGLTDARNTILLIARAELSGLQPESMLTETEFRPIGLLADWLKERQVETGDESAELPDPALVSAVVGGAVFALQTLGPWLMTAVGLKPEDVAARRPEILAILMDVVTRAAGSAPGGTPDET
jgi:AcrR family transcriptional regulator